VRVIAGRAKGRRLQGVPGSGTRPITDRAKAALFDVIGNDVVDACFLDLYAGTGQVGIEALSRGAKEAVFVEKERSALWTIRKNLAHTRLAGARVVIGDVFEYVAGAPEAFDYVYLAPPQYQGLWSRTLDALDRAPGWFSGDGWAIAQIHPREYELLPLKQLELFDRRSYGSVMLCYYRRVGGAR
jgi:16S rRNA (guanine(966)-N(2))-methyltransferase RsmD